MQTLTTLLMLLALHLGGPAAALISPSIERSSPNPTPGITCRMCGPLSGCFTCDEGHNCCNDVAALPLAECSIGWPPTACGNTGEGCKYDTDCCSGTCLSANTCR